MNLEKRNSYASKSILSLLQTTNTLPEIKPIANQYLIPSIVLIIFSIISLWAIIFYFILGICYYFHSGILVEDLHFLRLRKQVNLQLFNEEIDKQFSQLSFHCFFSVGLYFILLLLCLFLLRYRKKTNAISYQDPK